MSNSRPEHQAPPEIYYNSREAEKYHRSSRVRTVQQQLTERAIELLALDQPNCLILDLGCGSGLSGDVLEQHGHQWLGFDVSSDMLDVARDSDPSSNVVLSDLGQGLPLRSGVFDGAISISAIQWLCNQDKSCHKPWKRLNVFFQSLFNALKHGARAVLQFYPESASQMELISSAAMRCGFTGGFVVDYPNSTKAKKVYLCLFVGNATASKSAPAGADSQQLNLPAGLNGEPQTAAGFIERDPAAARAAERRKERKARRKAPVKSVDWILAKKERARRQGKQTARESRFTGRKRGPKF